MYGINLKAEEIFMVKKGLVFTFIWFRTLRGGWKGGILADKSAKKFESYLLAVPNFIGTGMRMGFSVMTFSIFRLE